MTPYLREVQPYITVGIRDRRVVDRGWFTVPTARDLRTPLCKKYAWAIPTEEAIAAVADLSPIVEIGAGNGYWAQLIRQAGATVHAYDNMSWHDQVQQLHSEVLIGTPQTLKYYTSMWTLFLCWPPYSSRMAYECLRLYRGNTIVYVGEGEGGCTGDDRFHQKLQKKWELEQTIDLLNWDGINDDLQIWRRK